MLTDPVFGKVGIQGSVPRTKEVVVLESYTKQCIGVYTKLEREGRGLGGAKTLEGASTGDNFNCDPRKVLLSILIIEINQIITPNNDVRGEG